MATVAIHCEPRIAWQGRAATQMQRGLRTLGFDAQITGNRYRCSDVAVLLGTSCWRTLEDDEPWLLIDRASYGDPDFVQLVWNGHGRRGNHKVPQKPDGMRWAMHSGRFQVFDWVGDGSRVVLCGQTQPWSPNWATLQDWYTVVCANADVTHFRQHPAGQNPTTLPLINDWGDVGRVITLNSSIGVESVMNGIPTVTMDPAGMAWEVSGHSPRDRVMPNRRNWLEWLAWTQWSWQEIEAGHPISHHFEGL